MSAQGGILMIVHYNAQRGRGKMRNAEYRQRRQVIHYVVYRYTTLCIACQQSLPFCSTG